MTSVKMVPTSIDRETTPTAKVVWFYSEALDVGICFTKEELKDLDTLEKIIKEIKRELQEIEK